MIKPTRQYAYFIWLFLEIVMNELRKNQNFYFDLQIHPTNIQ